MHYKWLQLRMSHLLYLALRNELLLHLKTYNLYYEGQNLQLRHREVRRPWGSLWASPVCLHVSRVSGFLPLLPPPTGGLSLRILAGAPGVLWKETPGLFCTNEDDLFCSRDIPGDVSLG